MVPENNTTSNQATNFNLDLPEAGRNVFVSSPALPPIIDLVLDALDNARRLQVSDDRLRDYVHQEVMIHCGERAEDQDAQDRQDWETVKHDAWQYKAVFFWSAGSHVHWRKQGTQSTLCGREFWPVADLRNPAKPELVDNTKKRLSLCAVCDSLASDACEMGPVLEVTSRKPLIQRVVELAEVQQ